MQANRTALKRAKADINGKGRTDECWVHPKPHEKIHFIYTTRSGKKLKKALTVRQAVFLIEHELDKNPKYVVPLCEHLNCINPRHAVQVKTYEEVLTVLRIGRVLNNKKEEE